MNSRLSRIINSLLYGVGAVTSLVLGSYFNHIEGWLLFGGMFVSLASTSLFIAYLEYTD